MTESNYANCYLDYNRLTRITEVEKPYKITKVSTTPNRYPLVDRNHNHKYFIPEELNGEKVYRVYYYYTWSKENTTEEIYNSFDEATLKQWTSGKDWKGEQQYFKFTRTPREVGIVYPDNSFEFTASKCLDQGLRGMFARGWFKPCTDVVSQVNRGGVVMFSWSGSYTSNNRYNWHPIFKGLRINLHDNSVHHSCKYEVSTRKVIRKVNKELFSYYKEDIKVAKVIASVMGKDQFIQELINVNTLHPNSDDLKSFINTEGTSPVDKILALCLLYSINTKFNLHWILNNSSSKNDWWYKSLDVESLINSVLRIFKNELIRENENIVLTEVVHTPSEIYPQTKWGVIVRHNGNIVEQYKS